MTTSAGILQNYLSLVTSQHADKPKFNAWLSALLQPFCDMQALLQTFPSLFSVQTAIGQQLDVIGQWVGISRALQESLTGVYFSLDTAGVGLNQGIIYNPNTDSLTGLVQLDDDVYRLLLNAKIAYNAWDGTVASAETFMNNIFSVYNYSFCIQDNQDKTMYEGIIGGSAAPPAFLQQMLLNGLFDLRPSGIIVHYFWQSDSNPVFALDVDNSYFGGLDHGSMATFI